jgi:hypothetical protein
MNYRRANVEPVIGFDFLYLDITQWISSPARSAGGFGIGGVHETRYFPTIMGLIFTAAALPTS